MKKHIPNLLTLGNLAFGILGILVLSESLSYNSFTSLSYTKFQWAFISVIFASIFDFFDGLVARKLGVSGELGKQLDSLADMVTFGVLPGIFIYQYFLKESLDGLVLFSFLLVPLSSAMRLAKFNIDTRQNYVFLGLPTPANAVLITSLAFWFNDSSSILNEVYFILSLTILVSILLIVELPMIAFKQIRIGNRTFYHLLILVLFFFIGQFFIGFKIIFPTLIIYILMSIIEYQLLNNRHND